MENFEQFLNGKLIIACPKTKNNILSRSIIYICSQDEDETIGFIVNKKQNNISSCETLLSTDFNMVNIIFYKGGDKETCKVFIIHTNDYIIENSISIDEHISISSSTEIINDIGRKKGPKKSRIVLGYLQWDTQNLIKEIKKNDWWILDSNDEIVFSENEHKWEEIMLENLNIDTNRLSITSGNA